MSQLHQYRSNRLEWLAGHLARLFTEAPPADPMEPLIVVVQTPGIARWLNMRLADELGCCMNIRYLYPRNFVEEMLERWLGEAPGQMETGELVWRIFGLLPELAQKGEQFASIRDYLADGVPIKRLQLAERLAGLYDQYATYRPEMLLQWETGQESTDWQAGLWQRLVEARATPARHLFVAMQDVQHTPPCSPLPAHCYVFGVSTLPPLYISFLKLLGQHSTIHLLNLDPTSEYWGDSIGKRYRERLHLTGDPGAEDLFTGHPLLASMGKQGRDFNNLLVEDFNDNELEGSFIPTPGDSLLAQLQNDILELNDLSEPDSGARMTRADGDTSITVASCHNATRELEALRDHLLHLFDTVPDLRPRDILVLTPDIEALAPYVEAVFGCAEAAALDLPYSVADRGPRGQSRLHDAFFAVLELAGSRLTAREVLGVLEHPAVAARFHLNEPELERVRDWVRELRICWGRDAAHREALGFGPEAQNSWRSGLDRVILGAAMRGGDAIFFNDCLPFDEIEGDAADLAGRVCEAVDILLDLAQQMEQPLSMGQWQKVLTRIVEELLTAPDDDAHELPALRQAIAGLAAASALLQDPDERLDAASIRHVLDADLRERRPPGAFLGGRITFAELKPMRSVPAKVICMVGMNETAFPRQDTRLPIDLVSAHPQPGDRSQRMGDRYLFLESLLSARSHLYISYCGQGGDGKQKPPSVLVSELLDYLALALGDDGRTDPEPLGLLVRHRLHPFSESYFLPGSPLFSYSGINREAAQALRDRSWNIATFIGEDEEIPVETPQSIRLEDFINFFNDASGSFLKNSLQLRTARLDTALTEDEPDSVDKLERFKIADDLLHLLVEQPDADPEPMLRLLRAKGALPWGEAGRAYMRQLRVECGRIRTRVLPYMQAKPTLFAGEALVPVGNGNLRITFEEKGWGDRLVYYRPAPVKEKNMLSTWLKCLVLQSSLAGPIPREVIFVAQDKTLRICPTRTQSSTLQELVALYIKGQRVPIPFFPSTSFKAVVALEKADNVMAAANKEWYSDANGNRTPESEHWAVRVLYGDKPLIPRQAQFKDISATVWAPYLDEVEEVK